MAATEPAPTLAALERRENGGWEWEIDFGDDCPPVQYRTDVNGQGLWFWNTDTNNGGPCWKQSRGHLQWSLPDEIGPTIAAICHHWKATRSAANERPS